MPDAWDDLRYLLALHRSGSLAGAARRCAVNETTVARRLKRLDETLGTPLFLRSAGGRYDLTDAGRRVLTHAEAMERVAEALDEDLGRLSDGVSGTVRISAVPIIADRFLIPRLAAWLPEVPGLDVQVVAEAANVDLTRRDADIAVRFARPGRGGHAVTARRLGSLAFGFFGPAGGATDLPVIGYDDRHATLPQAVWSGRVRQAMGRAAAALTVADLSTAASAVAAGHGLAALPRVIASAVPGLSEVPTGVPDLQRDVWLLSPADRPDRAAVVAVKDWLAGLDWR